MIQSSVFIICGVHNGLNYTKELLICISKQSYPNIKTIIIDDDSSDGTCEYIKKNYSEIILIKGNGNLWWTGALYEGVEKVMKLVEKNDFILTVNNDCVFDKDFIQNLVDISFENKRAIVGSMVIDINNRSKIIDAGVQIDWLRGKYISLPPKNTSNLPKNKLIQDKIDTLSTKGSLYPIEVFKKVGNFDKIHLPHYISDYEFACRAKKKGFNLLISLKARIYNDTNRTGLGEKISGSICLKELWELLFSRKSRLNIIDQFWFITLSCPKKYLLVNYFAIIVKVLFLLSYVYPFYLIHSLEKK